ncbi:hypothetical protein A0256_03535 [Mucilaginibacter sp. PAMC 26640]|nr:hypothetical protein A0256_03535 [Mucilaginibacter sp. PAMC 26640]
METSSQQVQAFFIEQLNSLYCAEAHLVERLEEINDEPAFAALTSTIKNAIISSERKSKLLDQIFAALDVTYNFDNCAGLISFLEDSFTSFRQYTDMPYLSYMLILSYLQNVKSTRMNSCRLLRLLSEKLYRPEITILINQICEDGDNVLNDELMSLYSA